MGTNWSKVQLSLRPTNDEELRVATEFGDFWAATRTAGEALGWHVSAGSRVQLYFQWNGASAASEIFVSPSKRDRFLVRITPQAGKLDSIRAALGPVVPGLSGAEMALERVTRSKGVKFDVVEIRSTWEDVIGDDSPAPSVIASRLQDFVVPILRAVPTR